MDGTTIEGLWDAHQNQIFNFLYRMLANRLDAEEVTQETFLRAYRSMERGSFIDDRPRQWLFRIATNAALDEFRRRKVLTFVPLDAAFVAATGGNQRKANNRRHVLRFTDRANVERDAIATENVAEVRTALEALSQNRRTVLVLRYHEGLSCEEIGTAMGITRGAVKSLIFRAKNELRANIEAITDAWDVSERAA
jgi:RNA polymerase sigma-70 factor (ECF subfamily)